MHPRTHTHTGTETATARARKSTATDFNVVIHFTELMCTVPGAIRSLRARCTLYTVQQAFYNLFSKFVCFSSEHLKLATGWFMMGTSAFASLCVFFVLILPHNLSHLTAFCRIFIPFLSHKSIWISHVFVYKMRNFSHGFSIRILVGVAKLALLS